MPTPGWPLCQETFRSPNSNPNPVLWVAPVIDPGFSRGKGLANDIECEVTKVI